jgi:hypothetical protein
LKWVLDIDDDDDGDCEDCVLMVKGSDFVIRIGVSQSEIAPWLQSLNTARAAGFLF